MYGMYISTYAIVFTLYVYVYVHVCMHECTHNSYPYISFCRFENATETIPLQVFVLYKLLIKLTHKFTFCATLSIYLFVSVQ